MDTLLNIGIPALVVILMLIVIGVVFSRLYVRASKERAFVRTGLGGQKVIMDGGALVLPVFHETILVNMNTLKLEVSRKEEASLIAKDRMRVDVSAAFFVRVKQNAEAVGIAAQTLGRKTLEPDQLKMLVEDKFVDALRSTAATMTMKELQDQRREFVQAVQEAVAEDLTKNGLELESVSLTSLDQTAKEFFNPNNAFDAEGLTRLTEQTESRRQERNAIEQDTNVKIRDKNLTSERQRLQIERDTEFATLTQKQEVSATRAEQAMMTAKVESERTLESEQVLIETARQVKERRIEADRAVELAEIAKNLLVKKSQIESERETSILKAQQRQVVEVAEQDSLIAIAEKSQEQSKANAAANAALADAVKSEEDVITAREVAIAERTKNIQLIDANRAAEQGAIGIRVNAEVEKEAAENRAQAIRVVAQANRDSAVAEAEGVTALNTARNTMGAEQIAMTMRIKLLDSLPAIITQMVKPMEKIDSIKIVQLNGMPGVGGAGSGAGSTGSTGGGSLPEQFLNSALSYQAAKPLLDGMLKDAGLAGGSLDGMINALGQAHAVPAAVVAVAPVEEAAVRGEDHSISDGVDVRPSSYPAHAE